MTMKAILSGGKYHGRSVEVAKPFTNIVVNEMDAMRMASQMANLVAQSLLPSGEIYELVATPAHGSALYRKQKSVFGRKEFEQFAASALSPLAEMIVRPDVKRSLQVDTKTLELSDAGAFFGMHVFEKPGQRAMCWAISDRTISAKYLSGELTEDDLYRMAAESENAKKIAAL